jgi:hypothetical protein
MTKKLPQDIELVEDAWPRFERLIRAISKAGPQHRVTQKPKKTNASGTRATAKKRAPSA